MSSSSDDQSAWGNNMNTTTAASSSSEKKYKGVRRRKWGKWVSEIRVPGTSERLWLGSYATAEAAAVAHDVAFYCLRGNSSAQNLNFPSILPAGARVGLSPRSVQKAASDAGLAMDARLLDSSRSETKVERSMEEQNGTAWHWQEGGDHSWGVGGSSSDWFRQSHEGEHHELSISVEDYL